MKTKIKQPIPWVPHFGDFHRGAPDGNSRGLHNLLDKPSEYMVADHRLHPIFLPASKDLNFYFQHCWASKKDTGYQPGYQPLTESKLLSDVDLRQGSVDGIAAFSRLLDEDPPRAVSKTPLMQHPPKESTKHQKIQNMVLFSYVDLPNVS